MAEPAATVVIPCWRSERTVASCLGRLADQSFEDFEVIVVNSSPADRTAAIVARTLPEATYVESSRRLLPHAARDLALERSRGAILVSTDPDCVPDREWLERLTAPIRDGRSDLAVGAMGLLPSGRRATGIHLCKYATYLPGLAPGRRSIAPSANLAMSRRLWEEVGPFPPDEFAGDAMLSWRAEERFGPATFVPDAVVRHHHGEDPVAFMTQRRRRGREYAAARIAHFGWSRPRAGVLAASLPLLALPPVAIGTAAALRAGLGSSSIGGLPLHLAGHVAWTVGEARTYLRHAWTGGS